MCPVCYRHMSVWQGPRFSAFESLCEAKEKLGLQIDRFLSCSAFYLGNFINKCLVELTKCSGFKIVTHLELVSSYLSPWFL